MDLADKNNINRSQCTKEELWTSEKVDQTFGYLYTLQYEYDRLQWHLNSF